jgi:hypothetical protein
MNKAKDVGLSASQIWALYMSRAHKLIRTSMGWSDHAMLRTNHAVVAHPAPRSHRHRNSTP